MLNFGNKEFRNLEEQVGKNQEDIKTLKSGIIVSYNVIDITELTQLLTQENVGKYVYVSGTKKLYLITNRVNGGIGADNLGPWPAIINGTNGTNGTNGVDGLGILGVGTVLPSALDTREGELFIHLVNRGTYYEPILKRLETSKWNTKCSLKGLQGPKGEMGEVNVVANPTGEATNQLHKLDVDGVVYYIEEPAVDSVNGKTGVIVLDAEDVGALPDDTEIPTKTSDLTNDSGFITSSALSGYATENYVDQSVTGLVTQSEVDDSIEEALEDYTPTTGLATVALTGSYSNLSNKPTIPTKTSDIVNDSGFITNTVNNLTNYTKTSQLASVATSGSYNDLSNKPTLATVATTGSYNNLIDRPSFAAVATSGSYNSLIDKPTIPTDVSDLYNDAGYITNTVTDLMNYTLSTEFASVATSGNYNDLINKPNLSQVATTGEYMDLNGKPDIPHFTSDLQNDSGFIDNNVSDLMYYTTTSSLSAVATSGEYNDLYNKPTIPTVLPVQYRFTAPTSDNPDEGLIVVILSSEPTTKYDGYLYFIEES